MSAYFNLQIKPYLFLPEALFLLYKALYISIKSYGQRAKEPTSSARAHICGS